MSKPVQIFLCHASEDKPKVIEVYRFLKQQGFKPWLDKEDLLPGQRWDQEIPKALKASDFILIFFSQNSVSKRGYVQREFKLALEVLEEIPERQIFVIPVRLDACAIPERFQLLHYCDLFEEGGLEKVVRAIRESLQNAHQAHPTTPAAAHNPSAQFQATQPRVLLRSQAVEHLSIDAVKAMLREKDFFDVGWHQAGRGLKHQYKVAELNAVNVVLDQTTGLMWQQGGSAEYMSHLDARRHVQQLNRDKFAGYIDWRLPTLEEAMSLMESEKKNGDLYIDPVFDHAQRWIWTADEETSFADWSASFVFGSCGYNHAGSFNFVRAVRSAEPKTR